MANCKYRELKKTIQLLQSNQLSNDSIQELINSYRNIHTPKELLDAFIKYCYHLDYISSQVHAKELLKDIDKNLSQSEILLIESLNNISISEYTVQVQRILEKYEIINKYRRISRERKNAIKNTKNFNVFQYLYGIDELHKQLEQELMSKNLI